MLKICSFLWEFADFLCITGVWTCRLNKTKDNVRKSSLKTSHFTNITKHSDTWGPPEKAAATTSDICFTAKLSTTSAITVLLLTLLHFLICNAVNSWGHTQPSLLSNTGRLECTTNHSWNQVYQPLKHSWVSAAVSSGASISMGWVKHEHAVLRIRNKADEETYVCFSAAVTLVISQVDDRYQKGQTAYQSESWTLRFTACDLLCFQPDFEPTRDSGRGFMWRSVVQWVSLLLIPPLFPAHNKARPRPGPHTKTGFVRSVT